MERNAPSDDTPSDSGSLIAWLPPKLAACEPVIKAARVAYIAMPEEASWPPINDFDELVLTRSFCFGDCPDYRLTIRGNGTVAYQGNESVRVKGKRTAKLEPGEKAALLEGLNRLQFLSLQDYYQAWLDGCEQVSTDLPTISIRLKSGDIVKSVTFYEGCEGADRTQAVVDLASLIDVVADRRAWLKPASKR